MHFWWSIIFLKSPVGCKAAKNPKTDTHHMKTDTHLINILTETAPCFEIFCITKITVKITFTLHATPDKFLGHPTESEEAKKRHINILSSKHRPSSWPYCHIMVVFTD